MSYLRNLKKEEIKEPEKKEIKNKEKKPVHEKQTRTIKNKPKFSFSDKDISLISIVCRKYLIQYKNNYDKVSIDKRDISPTVSFYDQVVKIKNKLEKLLLEID